MKGFAKFRDGFVGPVLILTVISLLVTWAVAATYQVTDPIIQVQEAEKARLARQAVLPEADDFTRYDLTAAPLLSSLAGPFPQEVTEAYRANNGAGFVFKASAKGYDGKVPFMIGIDSAGNIAGIQMMTNNETKGLGSRVGEPEYLAQYVGGSSPDGVDAISGATKTSTALKNALRAALAAYEMLQGINP